MQQISAGSGLQGSQAQGSVSSQSTRSVGDPPQSSRAISSRPKKRERSDPVCDPVKQQRTDKGSRRCGEERDSTLKPEASSLVGKDGGISSVASVDRLVCIMQYEWNDSAERQLDLVVSRTMLCKVVATTSEQDCLVKFLKLGGLAILDKWLQEAHRGKHFANKEISEDGEKAVEDLLLTLLGALERLPVDLVALKTCPVGKSVNLLRNHKLPEIQRRSKKLVDTWKKRVESEMKQSVEGRFPIDPSLSIQQQELGINATKSQQACYPEHPAHHGNVSGGRGKFASVASLCSLQEGQPKAPSALIPIPSVVESSGDMPRKDALTAHLPSRPYKGEFLESSRLSSPCSEDGRTKSSMDVTFAQLPSDQVRASKSTGASRNRRSANTGSNKICSNAGALSGPVNVSKDSSASGSKELYGFAAQSGVSLLPCCNSAHKNPQASLVYDGLSRSSINSLSSCATDCNNRSSDQTCMCVEPVKAGIQLLANIAASEGSMVDVKGSDSPSNLSVSMQRMMTIPVESSALPVSNMKCYSQPLMKAANRVQDGEHYDQISSNVSSPSETSAHVDIRVCESKRTLDACAYMSSPHDTTSETSLPTTIVKKDGGRKCGALTSVEVDQWNMQAASENKMVVSLQSALEFETVGESYAADKMKSKDTSNVQLGTGPKGSILKGGLHRPSSLRQDENDSLGVARQVAVEIQQEVADSHGGSFRRGITDRNFSLSGDVAISGMSVDAKTQDSLQKAQVLFQSEGIVPAKHYVIERPVFDLNEMLISEDVSNQALATSSSLFTLPTQDSSVVASGSAYGLKPAVPFAPMAPIAVVAAAKGPFTLPSVSYLPKGDFGWKGSAPTSAFRPTQPRHYPQKPNPSVAEPSANLKVVMDFDLNVEADSGYGDHDMGLSSSTVTASLPTKQGTSASNFGSSAFCQKTSGQPGAAWDLNQVDEGVAESQGRPDFDLNSGPVLQDNDDVVLSSKHHGNRAPLTSDIINSGAANRMPSHPLSSVTPIMMPAFAMTNSEFPYSLGAAAPWTNPGPHDGMFQYNILLQNQPGMACPPLPSMPTGPYGGFPFGFSPASMQSFSAPFMDTLCGPHAAPLAPPSASNGEQSLQSKPPPYMMGILADAIQHQGKGGFWSLPNLDLNAGPDGIDAKNAKDDRRHMLVINEQMRARQAMDMGAVLKQREQEGYPSMPGSMQGAQVKQPVWR